MFGSISSCTPNSSVSTQFRSTQKQILDIWANVTITVNGEVNSQRPIRISNGDIVTATVTSPPDYLGYKFYTYSLNAEVQSFAVVNKNNYSLTVVKAADAKKRWYNYVPKNFTISFNDDWTEREYQLGFGRQLIDVDELHIVLDSQNKAVVFYSKHRANICRVPLPDSPVRYKKIPADTPEGTYTQELLVLCSNGRLYRIRFDSRYSYSDEFKPAVLPVFPLEDLPYLQDLPNGGSFTDVARARFLRSLFPVVAALDYRNGEIWIAGSNTVFVVNRNFTLLNTITIGALQILDIACLGDGAVVVTKDQQLYGVNRSGGTTLIYSAGALGSPCTMPNGNTVAVPDSNARQILIVNSNLTYTTRPIADFYPAYAMIFDGYLWVTGHDSNMAVKFNTDTSYSQVTFKHKTALVSVVENSVLAIHCMQDFATLDNTNFQKFIPYTPATKRGPVSHIGSQPHQIKLLGRDLVYAIPGPGVTCWVNGYTNYPITNNDWITASYQASAPGTYRCNFIIGETAIDFDVSVVSSAELTDHFLSQVPATLISQPYTTANLPTVGNINEGVTYLNLGFNFAVYGNTYSNIGVTTNGYIGFGSNVDLVTNPAFGAIASDIIYVEPQDLYQGLPINNVNPLNITTGRLDSGEIPGVYYRPYNYDLFSGFRVRWVGTSMNSYPLGNTLVTVYTTVNHNEVLVPTLVGINVADYISGNNVLISTQVTGLINYEANVEVYSASGLRFLTAQPAALKKYSRLNDLYSFYNYAQTSTQLGTRILSQNVENQLLGNVIVDGVISGNVTNFHVFEFPYNQNGTLSTVKQVKTRNITTESRTITSLARWGNNPSANIYVSSQDYDKVYVNQTLYAANITTTTVASKSAVQKSFTLQANYRKISEGYLETIYTPPVLDSNSNVIVNGFWTNTVIQGNTVTFTLTTTNVPVGSQFPYTVASVSGLVTSDDFVGNPPLSGVLTVPGNGVTSIQFRAKTDFVVEGIETFVFTVSNLSVISTDALSHEITISEDQIPDNSSTTTTRVFNEYKLTTNANQFVPYNTVINLDQTTLSFDNPVFTNGTLYGNVTYSLYEHFLFEPGLTLGTDILDKYQDTKTLANFTGNFATISNSASIAEGTSILFKANVAHPAYSYEVGFYTGRSFQYIEITHDNNNHSANTTIGISSGDASFYSVQANVATRNSILFGSFALFGNWIKIGTGSFSDVLRGFIPRELEFYRVKAQSSDYAKYEAIVDQNFPLTSNVYCSINYGYLQINQNENIFYRKLKTNDVVTVIFPFGLYKSPIAPLLSIGDFQMPITAVAEVDDGKYQEITTLYTNVPGNRLLSGNVTVTVAGDYTIPQYYRTSAQTNFIFRRIRSGAVTVLTGIAHNFLVGDQIWVENVYSSSRLYDTRTIAIVGPSILRIVLRSESGTIFNYMDFGLLENPYTRYYPDRIIGTNPYIQYDDPDLGYQTNSIIISSTTNLSGNLVVNTPGISVYVNDTLQSNNYAVNVSTGSNIKLAWAVGNYFQSNAIVYQHKIDSIDSSNVYIPVGVWAVNNLPISTEGILYQPTINLGNKTHQWLPTTTVLEFSAPTADIINSESTLTSEISSQYQSAKDEVRNQTVTSQYLKSQTQILNETADEALITGFSELANKHATRLTDTLTVIKSSIAADFQKSTTPVTSNAADVRILGIEQVLYSKIMSGYIESATTFSFVTVSEFTKYPTIVTSSSEASYRLPATFIMSSNLEKYYESPTIFFANTVVDVEISPNVYKSQHGVDYQNQATKFTSKHGIDYVKFNQTRYKSDFIYFKPETVLMSDKFKFDLVQYQMFVSNHAISKQESASMLKQSPGIDMVYRNILTSSHTIDLARIGDVEFTFDPDIVVLNFSFRQLINEIEETNLLLPDASDPLVKLQNTEFKSNNSAVPTEKNYTNFSADKELEQVNTLLIPANYQIDSDNVYFSDLESVLEDSNQILTEISNQQDEITLIEYAISSQFYADNIFTNSITDEFEIPNLELFPISMQYEIPNLELFPISMQYETPNPRLFPISVKYETPNPRLFPISVKYETPNPRLFSITHEFYKETTLLPGIQKQYITANPIGIRIQSQYNTQNPVLKTIQSQYITPKIISKTLQIEFQNAITWNQPLDLGVFSTYFLYYHPGGRGGDNLLAVGPPVNYIPDPFVSPLQNNTGVTSLGFIPPVTNRAPYLPYAVTGGSSLALGAQSGIFYIHSGNVLTHINGTNWHYNVDYSHSIIKVNSWTLGSGSTTGYYAVGDSAENTRIVSEDPWGQKNIIWQARGTGTEEQGGDQLNGGWDSDWIEIDPDKAYRSVVWVRRVSTSANGAIYHGTFTNGTAPAYPNSELDNNGDPISIGNVVRITDNLAEWDPYWSITPAEDFEKDQWYLLVGVIYPRYYRELVPIDKTGIYNSYGLKIAENNGSMMMGGKFPLNTTHMRQRVYALYSYDADTVFEFAFPRLEVMDMMQPTIPALCRAPQSIKFASSPGNGEVNVANGTITFAGLTFNLSNNGGSNYGPGGYKTYQEALVASQKFANAVPIPIPKTDYWNYRIYFDYVTPLYGVTASSTTSGYEAVFTDLGETIRINATGLDCDEIVSYRIEPALLDIEYLVVGGGGGGGAMSGGGGGGGGVFYGFRSNIELEKEYPVTIGAGGIGGNITSNLTSTSGSASLFIDIEALGGSRGGNGVQGNVQAKFTAAVNPAIEGIPADTGVWTTKANSFVETFFINLASGTYTVYTVSSGTHTVHLNDKPTIINANVAGSRYLSQVTVTSAGTQRLRVFSEYAGPLSYITLLIKSGNTTVYNLRSIIDTGSSVPLSVAIQGGGGGAGGGGGGSNVAASLSGAGGSATVNHGYAGGAGTILSGGGGGGAGGPGTSAQVISQTVFETNANVTLGNARAGESLTIGIGVAGNGGPGKLVFQSCWTIGAGGGGGSYFYSNSTALFGGNGGLYGGGNGGAITGGAGAPGAVASGGGGGGGFVHAVYIPETVIYVYEQQRDFEGNLILDENGNPMPVLDGSGNPVPARDINGNLTIDYVRPPTVSSVTPYNGGNGAGGVVMLKYSKEYDIYLDPGLSGETVISEQHKITYITSGLGNISWKVPCFSEVKQVCAPRKGSVFPVKWWIKGG